MSMKIKLPLLLI